MEVRWWKIARRSALLGLASTGATLAIAHLATFYFGGSVTGTGLLMCIVCPMVIGIPASAYQLWRKEQLDVANTALESAKAELEHAHERLKLAFLALEHDARHDGLTGILNRGAFTDALGGMLRRTGGTLLFVDADRFKVINDRHGHPVGDQALCAMAEAMRRHLGRNDLLGRIGGEEFAIFLPGMSEADATPVAETLLGAIRAACVVGRGGGKVQLSASIGGLWGPRGSDLETLWSVADDRLYDAKNGGRDQVAIGERIARETTAPAAPGDEDARLPHTLTVAWQHAHPGSVSRRVDRRL